MYVFKIRKVSLVVKLTGNTLLLSPFSCHFQDKCKNVKMILKNFVNNIPPQKNSGFLALLQFDFHHVVL